MPVLPIYTASIAPRLLNNSITANASAATLQAICAWPVSGQYGPGTRILYVLKRLDFIGHLVLGSSIVC